MVNPMDSQTLERTLKQTLEGTYWRMRLCNTTVSEPIKCLFPLADLGEGGVRDARPSLWVQFLPFSYSFQEKIGQ